MPALSLVWFAVHHSCRYADKTGRTWLPRFAVASVALLVSWFCRFALHERVRHGLVHLLRLRTPTIAQFGLPFLVFTRLFGLVSSHGIAFLRALLYFLVPTLYLVLHPLLLHGSLHTGWTRCTRSSHAFTFVLWIPRIAYTYYAYGYAALQVAVTAHSRLHKTVFSRFKLLCLHDWVHVLDLATKFISALSFHPVCCVGCLFAHAH